jgi:tRNA-splicing ligase RtcB
MKWILEEETLRVPIRSWCEKPEKEAMEQAMNLANHPVVERHVALMPDCHTGYGMPIGGVIAAKDAILPSAVGVDIGCGMIAVETDLPAEKLAELPVRRAIQDRLKERVPVGEGVAHQHPQQWEGFERYLDTNGAVCDFPSRLDRRNLGTLGGGNHFAELQQSDEGFVWLMIHSGSRNLGARVEKHYQEVAKKLDASFHVRLPNPELAFLPMNTKEGQDYFRDMTFAMEYALENRRRMMAAFRETLAEAFPETSFLREINIHHNYAALEAHLGDNFYIHRKGATSAKQGEIGIIPGSMGTASYIVKGLGNPESFMSCSHGAGRVMSRIAASLNLTVEECDAAMDGIVHERWGKYKGFDKRHKGLLDLSEAPQAYKPIDEVIAAEADLVTPIVRLTPLAVLKG